MIKIVFNSFCLAIALISGISLFVLKYQVKAEEKQLQTIYREILQNKREIHMLEAEWAYLNDPQRLQALVHSQTNWQTIGPKQIVILSDIPMRPAEQKDEPEIIQTETERNESVKPVMQKEFVPVATRHVQTDNTKTGVVHSTSDESKLSLDSLTQKAKSLTQKKNSYSEKEMNLTTLSESKLTGSSEKDFVWSAKKKKPTTVSYPAIQRKRGL